MSKKVLIQRTSLLAVLLMVLMSLVGAESVLLFDDFSDGSLLNPPATTNNPKWKARHWSVPMPVDDGSGNMVLEDESFSIFAGDPEWTDYEVEIKFRVLSNNFYCLQTHLRYERDNEPIYYNTRILNTGPRLVYQVVMDGKQIDKAAANLGTSALDAWGTSWHIYKVGIVGNKITASIDGKEISFATVEPYASKGNFWIYVDKHGGTSGKHMQIDYIKVTEL